MSIASMTGFAREAGTTGPYQWAWELKTVNGRGLEVRVRTPSSLDAIGEEARGQILKDLKRGQGQLGLTLARGAGAAVIRVNKDILLGLIESLSGIDLPAAVKPASLDGLLAVRGVVEIDEDGGEPGQDAALAADLRAAIGRLIASLRDARLREGEALAAILLRQLDAVALLVDEAGDHVELLEQDRGQSLAFP
ncbi:MAG: YicC/YloC family endoribonuclease, partial [Microvirga sp.]